MTILGIGVDVVHVPRVTALIRRRGLQKFVSRILSPQELSDWNSLPACTTELARSRFLAVRWSVKEAAYKAMYPMLRPSWKELTYNNDGRKPSLLIQPHVPQDTLKLGSSHVSVSHDGDYVFASVVLEAPYTKL
ncbi:hypothetical protein M378DRAFT_116994 [Amanita muscaria Koide BX008]|uniref:4'-phosphopantetheinyl transferase domain-containing protein n=1 Tax=Amanita muscaria (strain Koide BX008) TaxID=946122 RepID=A0A0C2TS60_AMAMK|nr:hypothetical protein M378DRAFT_116994 [Amanita muscaria Koide BX008]